MRSFTIGALLLFVLAAAAGAAGFSGKYTTQVEGGEVILQLSQESGGTVNGILTAFGTAIRITGKASGGQMTGTAMMADTPAVRFNIRASRQGSSLTLEVTEIDPDGNPDPQTTERYTFTAAGGEEPSVEAPLAPSPSSADKPRTQGANPLAAKADPYVGTFRSSEMTVTISAAGGKYTGKISLSSGSFPFTARKGASGLEGTFTSEGDSFPFTAKVEGAMLYVSSGGTTYMLNRQGAPARPAKPANPLAGRSSSGKIAADPRPAGKKPEAPAGPPAWKVLRHPVGLSIRYPANWTAKPLEGASYQLIPPDAAGSPQAPSEAYFLMGAEAQNFARADDPGLLQILEGQVTQLAPFLQRVAGPNPVKSGPATGAVLAWEGANSAGQTIRARMYVVIVKGFAVCLFALGQRDRVEARDGKLREIFATLGASQEERDPRAVAVWSWVGERTGGASHSMQSTSSVSSTQASLVLQPDGSARRSRTSQSMVSSNFKNSLGESTGSLYLDTGPQTSTKNGRWYAGSGRLVLLWDDDTAEEYNYRVEGGAGGRRLLLTADKGGTEVWEAGPGGE